MAESDKPTTTAKLSEYALLTNELSSEQREQLWQQRLGVLPEAVATTWGTILAENREQFKDLKEACAGMCKCVCFVLFAFVMVVFGLQC